MNIFKQLIRLTENADTFAELFIKRKNSLIKFN